MSDRLITSKRYRYISLRIHMSDYMLKKFHKKDNKAQKLSWEMAQKYSKFRGDLYELLTNKVWEKTFLRYMPFHEDAIIEEIREVSGICLCRAEHCLIICIPKNEKTQDIIDFIHNVTDLKTKELKKTVGTYTDIGVSTYWRDACKDFILEQEKEYPEIINKFGDLE